ncbi:MAG: hypothetical protein IT340_19205 [Chloroflexi bacterium]|nr:hypothetical protein [Chloroflexota bacterium]
MPPPFPGMDPYLARDVGAVMTGRVARRAIEQASPIGRMRPPVATLVGVTAHRPWAA